MAIIGTGSTMDLAARVRQAARERSVQIGFGVKERAGVKTLPHGGARPTVSKESGGLSTHPRWRREKLSGKADLEAFNVQFELLALAAGWSEDVKALQLAVYLTDEDLTCLLLLNPAERDDYWTLVGAFKLPFGQCSQPVVLHSELASRRKLIGEPVHISQQHRNPD